MGSGIGGKHRAWDGEGRAPRLGSGGASAASLQEGKSWLRNEEEEGQRWLDVSDVLGGGVLVVEEQRREAGGGDRAELGVAAQVHGGGDR